MASRQQIKRRITSIRSTRQITRAMQLISASKLRKAQLAVQEPREYSRVAREMLAQLRKLATQEGTLSVMFKDRPVKKRLIIAISSDRTLAGAYNGNIIRRMYKEAQADQSKGIQTAVITLGRQVSNAAARVKGIEVLAAYNEFPEHPDANDLRPILLTAVEQFVAGEIDKVEILFTHFVSTVTQTAELQQILPAGFDEVETPSEMEYAEVEPSLEALLESAATRLLEAQLYQAVLESVASEHSMRMVAMKNATDNANDLIDDYTLVYNNARQAAITQELAEISGGAEALNG
jgi:F-type H+-transporting ATPase subunit gamma